MKPNRSGDKKGGELCAGHVGRWDIRNDSVHGERNSLVPRERQL